MGVTLFGGLSLGGAIRAQASRHVSSATAVPLTPKVSKHDLKEGSSGFGSAFLTVPTSVADLWQDGSQVAHSKLVEHGALQSWLTIGRNWVKIVHSEAELLVTSSGGFEIRNVRPPSRLHWLCLLRLAVYGTFSDCAKFTLHHPVVGTGSAA
jgi:hypothetical protein